MFNLLPFISYLTQEHMKIINKEIDKQFVNSIKFIFIFQFIKINYLFLVLVNKRMDSLHLVYSIS
jgi:hypothetical protein